MSDIRYCSRDFLTDFIELYKSLPCLWKVKCREYKDRNKKLGAYQLLINKYREIDSSATRETITKKINSLRSTYRKEVSKVANSKQNGEDYRPSLWYYNLLDFLKDEDTSKLSKRDLDGGSVSHSQSNREYSEPVMETDRLDDGSSSLRGQSNQSSEYEYSRANPTESEGSKGTKRSAGEEASSNSKVVKLIAEELRRTDHTISFQNDIFGKYVAEELNNMPPVMVPHVKKIISLAIFEGNMKTLNATSSIKTCVIQQSREHSESVQNAQNALSKIMKVNNECTNDEYTTGSCSE